MAENYFTIRTQIIPLEKKEKQLREIKEELMTALAYSRGLATIRELKANTTHFTSDIQDIIKSMLKKDTTISDFRYELKNALNKTEITHSILEKKINVLKLKLPKPKELRKQMKRRYFAK